MGEDMHVVALEQDNIDLREIYFLFQKNLKAIIIATLVGALVVFSVCNFFITPKYTATAKLYVVSASSNAIVNLNDLQIGSKLASDYKELILTRPMMESVIQKLQLEDETVSSLYKSIEIYNPDDTRILRISVTNSSPQKAADIANEVANLSRTWLPKIMEINAPNIAEEAVVSTIQSSPHTVRNTIIGGLGCGFLLYIIFIVSFLYDDTIKTSEEMEKYFGTVPLAVVPLEKKESNKENSNGHRGGRE